MPIIWQVFLSEVGFAFRYLKPWRLCICTGNHFKAIMTTNQRSTDSGPPPTTSRLSAPHRKQWLAWVALIGVLLLGSYFRTLGLFSWDDPSYRLHPDERFMTDVASLGRVPASLGQYFDSTLNPLNPRNNGKEFYVYGLLPQTLTRLAAVMLTPDFKLPAIVPENHSDNAAQIPNPELRVPKLLPLQALLNPTGLNLTEYGEIHKVGRAWSALFDIVSLLLVFLIGRRLYGRRVGIVGSPAAGRGGAADPAGALFHCRFGHGLLYLADSLLGGAAGAGRPGDQLPSAGREHWHRNGLPGRPWLRWHCWP